MFRLSNIAVNKAKIIIRHLAQISIKRLFSRLCNRANVTNRIYLQRPAVGGGRPAVELRRPGTIGIYVQSRSLTI